MGKSKRKHPDAEEILARPWCYYCERDFDDLKILINHQKAKHFKCERCGRRLNTAGGLNVHMTQVHKEALTSIDNALPNRTNLEVEIFGMEGIPPDVVQSHNQRVLLSFAQAEAERRASTGNPGPGSSTGGAAKKPKFESPEDLKKRLAEHKAKKAAEMAANASNTDAPLIEGLEGQSPGYGLNPSFDGNPTFAQQMPFAPAGNGAYPAYPQPYGQQGQMFQPNSSQYPPPAIGYASSPSAFPANTAFPPTQPYQAPITTAFPPTQFPPGPAQAPFHGTTRGFGSVSPSNVLLPPQQPARKATPPSRPTSLPAPPGLPQRPSFAAPQVNAFQMQQMHQGQLSGPPVGMQATPAQILNGAMSAKGPLQGQEADKSSPLNASVTNLPPLPAAAQTPEAEQASATNVKPNGKTEKKSKKDKEKEKPTRMVYIDDLISPEEKRARLPKYAVALDDEERPVDFKASDLAVAPVA